MINHWTLGLFQTQFQDRVQAYGTAAVLLGLGKKGKRSLAAL